MRSGNNAPVAAFADVASDGAAARFAGLYPRIRASMSERRFLHVLGVAHTATQLAAIHGEDPSLAALAALLHDYCKERPFAELEAMLSRAGWDRWPLQHGDRKVWHAWAGEIAAREELGLELPRSVAEAIRYHPTGHPDMDRLTAIVVVADYSEPGRHRRGDVDEIRRLSRINLDQAVFRTLTEKTRYLGTQEMVTPHPWSIAARDAWAPR